MHNNIMHTANRIESISGSWFIQRHMHHPPPHLHLHLLLRGWHCRLVLTQSVEISIYLVIPYSDSNPSADPNPTTTPGHAFVYHLANKCCIHFFCQRTNQPTNQPPTSAYSHSFNPWVVVVVMFTGIIHE